MRLLVDKTTRIKILSALRPLYKQANAAQKHEILNNFIGSTGYERKYAIVLLNKDERRVAKRKTQPRRALEEEALKALILVWNISNQICAKRLVPGLPAIVANLERNNHLQLSDGARKQLLAVSAATVDRLLKIERMKGARSLSHTKRASTLKNKVPLRTFAEWKDVQPGNFQIDTVCHSGGDSRNPFLCTLNMTDVATCWTIPIGIKSKTSEQVISAIKAASHAIPFPISSIAFDNGSEFMNDDVLAWCDKKDTSYSHGRAYTSNDQAWAEEKNRSVVRKYVGRHRYEGAKPLALLKLLYSRLHDYYNFFQPCQKLLYKRRDGARSYRKYDTAQTPYDRVIANNFIPNETKMALEEHRRHLDMYQLFQDIARLQDELRRHAVDVKPLMAAQAAQRIASHNFLNRLRIQAESVAPAVDGERRTAIAKTAREALSQLKIGTNLSRKELALIVPKKGLSGCIRHLINQGILKQIGPALYRIVGNEPLLKSKGPTGMLRKYVRTLETGKIVRRKELEMALSKKRLGHPIKALCQEGLLKHVGKGLYEVLLQSTTKPGVKMGEATRLTRV